MPTQPLRLRLTGAHVLRDRQMVARTVAIEGGRIAAGPFPAVDLSGYLILPGIVDPLSCLPACSAGRDVINAAQRLACAGVTTAWLGHNAHDAAKIAPAPAKTRSPDIETCIAAHDSPALSCDLRPALICERMMVHGTDPVLGHVRRLGVSLVVFRDSFTRRLAQSATDPEAFAAWAQSNGASAPELLVQLRTAYDGRAQIPRALCHLAEAFDEDGVLYGSHADSDGETRETWQMLGARLCFAPRAATAAAVAQAVGSPVIASALDLPEPRTAPVAVNRLIRAGRCQALHSDQEPDSLARAAFVLTETYGMSLPEAWRLISEEPAAIMGLPDRGVIAQGKRADLTIIHAGSKRVEATICHGRITHMTAGAAARFMKSDTRMKVAAE